MSSLKFALAAVCMVAATTVSAQTTLGDLLDKGAQKLTLADAQALPPLAAFRETAHSDARMTIHPDGTVVGVVVNKQGSGVSQANGTWVMQASGKRCLDVNLPQFNMYWKECSYAFRVGDQIFHVASDADRSAVATAYVLTAHIR